MFKGLFLTGSMLGMLGDFAQEKGVILIYFMEVGLIIPEGLAIAITLLVVFMNC